MNHYTELDLSEFLNQEKNKKTMLDELAEEYSESCGEPQDAIYLKEEWKKAGTITDPCFKEYCEEAFSDACACENAKSECLNDDILAGLQN